MHIATFLYFILPYIATLDFFIDSVNDKMANSNISEQILVLNIGKDFAK